MTKAAAKDTSPMIPDKPFSFPIVILLSFLFLGMFGGGGLILFVILLSVWFFSMQIGRMLARKYLISHASKLASNVPVGCLIGLIASITTPVCLEIGILMTGFLFASRHHSPGVKISGSEFLIYFGLSWLFGTLLLACVWFFAYVGSASLHQEVACSRHSRTSALRFNIRTLLVITAIVAVCVSFLRMNTVPFLPPISHSVFDMLRRHQMRLSTEVNGYSITLVQKSDWIEYITTIEILSPESQNTFELMVHLDDGKWRKPNIYEKAGKIYFRDGSKITTGAPYVDVQAMTIHNTFGITGDGNPVPLDKLK